MSVALRQGAGSVGFALFLFAALASTGVVFLAQRNVKLFADGEVVGRIGFFGGTTTCPRADLADVRVVWHKVWSRRSLLPVWAAPVLHFRRRDMTDAFVTPALLYRSDDLAALGRFLGFPIDVDQPPATLD